jgi:hypothetical protein
LLLLATHALSAVMISNSYYSPASSYNNKKKPTRLAIGCPEEFQISAHCARQGCNQ